MAQPTLTDDHYQILANSAAIVLARIQDDTVVGFTTAISDGISCAYIPHLEVLPAYQGRGIGTELVRRMLEKLNHLYMIDLVCDPELKGFYEQLGMRAIVGMVVRNYARNLVRRLYNSGRCRSQRTGNWNERLQF